MWVMINSVYIIQANIPPICYCKNTRECDSSIHNTKHTKHHHNTTWVQTKHFTNTALHNINNTVATGFNQPIPPTRTIAVALDMSKEFDTVNIHTLTDKLSHTRTYHIPYSDTSQTTSRDAWHTQHSGTTHLQNDHSNQEYHKAASFHPYSSTSTLQISHYLPTRHTQVDKRQRPTSQHRQDDMHTTQPRPS